MQDNHHIAKSWRRIPYAKTLTGYHVKRWLESPKSPRPYYSDEKWSYWTSPLKFRRLNSLVVEIPDDQPDSPECFRVMPRRRFNPFGFSISETTTFGKRWYRRLSHA